MKYFFGILIDFKIKFYLFVELLLKWRSGNRKSIISNLLGELDLCVTKMNCLLEIRN